MNTRPLKLGIVGLGRAFTLMLPTFILDKRIELVAATDPRDLACRQFEKDFNAPTYSSIKALCADPNIEAVYIASPHQFHAEHTRIAARAGKHILLEKPLAITMDQCHEIVETINQTGVVLIVGHSHSFNAPVLHAHHLLASGKWGPVRMLHTFNYTDFLYRPRRPEELDTSQGGGVVFSQGAHQIDILRLLGGGMVESVQARTGNWDPRRPTEGAYTLLLDFANGAFASATYSGYAHYDSDELYKYIGEMGNYKDPNLYGAARQRLNRLSPTEPEHELKAQSNYGSPTYSPPVVVDTPYHQHFGHLVISTALADFKIQPDGIKRYTNDSCVFEPIVKHAIPRIEVIDELTAAIWHNAPILHSAQWARATTEVCLAILASAQSQKAVHLQFQTESY